MRSFKSNENIHKKESGSYYVVSANKASSVTLKFCVDRASNDDIFVVDDRDIPRV